MKPIFIGLFTALALAGCATTPPMCNGSDKKPINTARALNQEHQERVEAVPAEPLIPPDASGAHGANHE